jgi:hypothetical protein
VGEKTTEFGAENSSEWVNELKTFVDKPVVLQYVKRDEFHFSPCRRFSVLTIRSPRQVMANSGSGLNKSRSTSKVSSVLKRLVLF